MTRRLTVSDLRSAKGSRKWLQLHVDTPAEAAAAVACDIVILSCEPDHNLEAIRQAAPFAFLSVGMPHGAVASPDEAVRLGFTMMRRGADAVYCSHSPRFIEAMAAEGIPVTGHVGLVPNRATWTNFRAVGRTAEEAFKVLRAARDIENAGAACIEVEVVPVRLAEHITRSTPLITMGMGCGSACDTQYLFSCDVLGTHAGHYPRHAKRYADFLTLEAELQEKRISAFRAFGRDVAEGSYPEAKHQVDMDDAAYDRFLILSQSPVRSAMDDLQYGTRNKRGDWAPNEPARTAPLFTFPPRPLALLKWLPSYFLPYNVLFALSAVAWWHFVLPEAEVMKTLHWGWILRLFIVNCAALFAFFGVFELRLYILRAQGNRFKYNGKWPSEQKSKAFFFESQNLDNMLRTFGTGMPIWTAIEVAILYAYANGYVPWLSFAEHPVYLFCLALVVPIIHETHFFLLHRAIHWPPLYKWVHSVHHNSVNPSPWSSLSMHPVEQFGYLGVALWHLVIPSNPLLALYQLHYAGFGAIPGHVGFDKVELTEDTSVDSHAYIHYLHHKYFEVNYGDGLIPFDRWFGTFHDGSKDGEARMQARYEKKKARANAAAK